MKVESSILLSALKFISCNNDHVCRLCFANTEVEEVSLFDSVELKRSYHEETITFEDMFSELCVPLETDLPQVICLECANAVISSFLFQKLCVYSSEKWSNVFKRFEQSLVQSEQINTDRQTAYLMLNESDSITYTSRDTVTSKTDAANKVKRIMNSRANYSIKKKVKAACIECDETFKTKSSLNKHLKKTHDCDNTTSKERIPCPQCAKYFATEAQVKDHSERVHHAKTIQCSKCAKMFSTGKLLKRHEKFHHTAAICKLCFVQFPSKNALRAHLDKHDVNKCERCNKNFLNRQTYKLHLKICGNPDNKTLNYFCDHCSKGYVRKNSLRTHLKVDHGFARVLSCAWCKKKFDAVSRLKNHIVKHTKERNFSCEQCGGKFVTQAALVYHIRLHTGEKPFPCDMCDESFLSASRRMEHKRRKHMAPTKECPFCQVKFVTTNQLKKHIERHKNPSSKLWNARIENLEQNTNSYTKVETQTTRIDWNTILPKEELDN